MKASLIISFYNKIEFLRLVLASCERQTMQDFEIVIADDGSKPNIVEEIKIISQKTKIPIQHIWHEDVGWRKNEIMNKAVAAAQSDYLIFIDGDCILHSHFIEEHYAARQINTCLTGRRANLSQKITEKLTPEKVQAGYLERKNWLLLWDSLTGKSNQVEKAIYIKSAWLRQWLNHKQKDILGCNFSIFKADFLGVNGFDERYQAPSVGEDNDLHYRLCLNEVKMKPVLNICIVYHLYHKQLERPSQNLALFAEVKKQAIAFTQYGIVKHSERL